jgi:hypothetical protein
MWRDWQCEITTKTSHDQRQFYELLTRAEIDEEPTAVAASSSTASTSVETPNEA